MKQRSFLKDERGVEPTVMKILVGIILVAIGLGVGVTVYQRFGKATTSYLNYSVSNTPNSSNLTPGESEVVSIKVRTDTNFEKEVELDSTGVPKNVDVSFSPDNGVPTFGSSMRVKVESNASPGTHTITVKATADGTEKTATFELEIE